MGLDIVQLLGWHHPLTHRQFETLAAYTEGSWLGDGQDRVTSVDASPVQPVDHKSIWLGMVGGSKYVKQQTITRTELKRRRDEAEQQRLARVANHGR